MRTPSRASNRSFRNESAFKTAIVEDLRARHLLAWRVGAALYGTSGWPDINVILRNGRTLYIEAKMPGKQPTQIQALRIAELKDAGAPVFWCDTWESYLRQAELHGVQ